MSWVRVILGMLVSPFEEGRKSYFWGNEGFNKDYQGFFDVFLPRLVRYQGAVALRGMLFFIWFFW